MVVTDSNNFTNTHFPLTSSVSPVLLTTNQCNEMPIMKKLLLSTVAFTGLLAASLQAGQEVYKQVAPPPPPMYGLGFYGAIDMGANVYQNRGGDRTFTGDNRINDPTDR